VKGYLEEILFKDGDLVKEGTPLYRIEKGLFRADVEQAQGALERSKAAHTLAVVQLQRAEELLARSASRWSPATRPGAGATDQRLDLDREANLMTAKIKTAAIPTSWRRSAAASAAPASPRAMWWAPIPGG
jgi:membrane fusion protein (multidrug efflux system)